jgi:hypothetical protein
MSEILNALVNVASQRPSALFFIAAIGIFLFAIVETTGQVPWVKLVEHLTVTRKIVAFVSVVPLVVGLVLLLPFFNDSPHPFPSPSTPVVVVTITPLPTPSISPSPNDPLQTYENNINALTGLSSSKPNVDHSPIPVRVQAASLTQKVLTQLNGNQKGQLMQFLYNAGLITYTHHDLPKWPPDVDIDMSHMDLSGAKLAGMNLSGTQINYINLSHANLQGTILNSADLYGANFRGGRSFEPPSPGYRMPGRGDFSYCRW